MKNELGQYALIFKALSDETRLNIFSMLSGSEEICACELLEKLHITQPTLSYHMKILTECELVSARKDGSWMRYKRNPGRITQIQRFLEEAGRTV